MGIGERFFSRIAGTGQAEQAMHGVALCFYGLALLQSIMGAVMAQSAVAVDALLLVFLAFHMHRHRSRAFAMGLVLAALSALTSTVLTRVENLQGGSNVFLAVVSVYLGWRALYAAIVYQRAMGFHTDWRVALAKNLAGLALFALFGLLVGAADDVGLVIGPRLETLLSFILMLSVVIYSLPFAPWVPWLGRRPLSRRTPARS